MTAMMGTSEYIRVVRTGGFPVTGLLVATETHRDKKSMYKLTIILINY